MTRTPDKPLVWLKGEVKSPPFTENARVEAGFLLRRLQQGELLALPHSRPMSTIGGQCHELRHCRSGADVASRVSRGVGRSGDSRRLQQEDRSHAPARVGHLPEAARRVPNGCRRKEGTMRTAKKTRLERAGWVVSGAAQFLKLSAQEQRFVEVKLALATGVRQLRERRGLTQAALAKRLGSSQSRVAKMESADTSVSLDLMMRSLLSIGATAGEIAKLIKNAEAA